MSTGKAEDRQWRGYSVCHDVPGIRELRRSLEDLSFQIPRGEWDPIRCLSSHPAHVQPRLSPPGVKIRTAPRVAVTVLAGPSEVLPAELQLLAGQRRLLRRASPARLTTPIVFSLRIWIPPTKTPRATATAPWSARATTEPEATPTSRCADRSRYLMLLFYHLAWAFFELVWFALALWRSCTTRQTHKERSSLLTTLKIHVCRKPVLQRPLCIQISGISFVYLWEVCLEEMCLRCCWS